ncbi:MAG: AAC(3) family N-acetyltransferase [Anaerolineae bacterium]|jgi:aminoglycoside 3-N-acetyltransferase|nr:AAC(3) family N-acetyltransferase [Anaerolineae bacterium]
MLTEKLAAEWRNAGLNEGDIVLIHSSLKRTFLRFEEEEETLDVQKILDSFFLAVGKSGTLLLPLFNFDFSSKGTPFDIRNTPSQMGSLTNTARLMEGAVRTGHPIYSFAVLGAQKEKFAGIDNFSGYGADSPFAVLRKLDGKIASLNLMDQNSMTFYHHVEEMHQVDYRYMKEFTADYTDWDGNTEERTYGLFVRNVEKGVLTHVNPCGELMWEAGLYSGCRPDQGCGMRVISANAMFDFVSDIIESGKARGILYRLEGDDE